MGMNIHQHQTDQYFLTIHQHTNTVDNILLLLQFELNSNPNWIYVENESGFMLNNSVNFRFSWPRNKSSLENLV